LNRGGSEFWRLLHVGECGRLDGLREKAGQDSIYVGAIKKTGNLRSYSVSGKMYETISKLFLEGIAASPGIVIEKAYSL